RRRDSLTNAPSFIRGEEERSIFHDRPTQRSPELVLIELRFVARNTIDGREAVRIGVEFRIAKKLIQVAVQGIRAGLGDDVDYGTGVASVLRVEGIGQHAKFGDAVWRRLHCWEIDKLIVSIATVHTEVVGSTASAIDRH